MRARGPLLLALTLLAATPLAAVTSPWHDDGPARVRLLSPWEAAPAAGELWLGLELALAPGWHAYWHNGGDAGYPPAVDFSGTAEVLALDLLFPVPERFDLPGDLVAFGYEESVIYPLRLETDFGAATAAHFRGSVSYVVCASECVPFTSPLALDLPLASQPWEATVDAARLAAARDRLPRPLPDGATVSPAPLATDTAGGTFTLTARGLPVPPTALFFAVHDLVELGRPERDERDDAVLFTVPYTWLDRSRTSEQLALAWTLAAGDGGWEGSSPLHLPAAARPATLPGGPAAIPAESANNGHSPTEPTRWPWFALAGVVGAGLLWALWPRAGEHPPA